MPRASPICPAGPRHHTGTCAGAASASSVSTVQGLGQSCPSLQVPSVQSAFAIQPSKTKQDVLFPETHMRGPRKWQTLRVRVWEKIMLAPSRGPFSSPPLPSAPLSSPPLSFLFSFPFPFLFLSFPHGRFLCGIIARKEARASPLLFPLAAFLLPCSARGPGTRRAGARSSPTAGVQACRRAGAGPPEQGGASTDWPRAGAAHALGKRASTVLNEALCAVPGTGLELSSGVSCPTRPGAGVRASLVHVEALPTPHGPTVHR